MCDVIYFILRVAVLDHPKYKTCFDLFHTMLCFMHQKKEVFFCLHIYIIYLNKKKPQEGN